MAYGFQYVPRLGAGRAPRPLALRMASAAAGPATVQVAELAPSARDLARAVEDLYRDIEELRALVTDPASGLDGASVSVAGDD